MKRIIFALMLVLLVSAGAVHAAPTAQFKGCADEQGMQFGARFIAHSLNGFNMVITAVGVDGYDPQITVLDASGTIVTCNEDSDEAAQVAVNLPSVTAEPSPTSARADVRVPGDQGRLDYTIIISSQTGTYGEFVMFYQGAEIRPASEVDEFTVVTNEGQVANEAPLGLYAVNLRRPEKAVYPTITFAYGDNFSQTCSKSSAAILCDGEFEDLTGYSVTLEDETPIPLNGDDAMLYYDLGGEAAEFSLTVASYQAASYGPYTLIIHSGTGYPKAAE